MTWDLIHDVGDNVVYVCRNVVPFDEVARVLLESDRNLILLFCTEEQIAEAVALKDAMNALLPVSKRIHSERIEFSLCEGDIDTNEFLSIIQHHLKTHLNWRSKIKKMTPTVDWASSFIDVQDFR